MINVIVLNSTAYTYLTTKKAATAIRNYLKKNNVDVVPIQIKNSGGVRYIINAEFLNDPAFKLIKDTIISEGFGSYIQVTSINETTELNLPFTPIAG